MENGNSTFHYTSEGISNLIKAYGYTFNNIPDEQLESAIQNASSIENNWPLEGSIQKFDDYFVVKLNDKVAEYIYEIEHPSQNEN